MAAPSKESSTLSELQRAAFEQWKDSTNKMEVQLRSHPTYTVGGGDFDCHVDVTLNIREDGNVDVLLNLSGRQESPNASQSHMDMPTNPCKPAHVDLVHNYCFEGDNEGGETGDAADLCRPQKMYLYFLELQRLKAIQDFDPNGSSKCASPRIPYEGGLSELQRAAFKKWSNDGEMVQDQILDQIASKNFASLNLKDGDSMQPTMSTLKGDMNSVLELEPVLKEVALQL